VVALALPDPCEERLDGRPIRRAFPDVKQGHPSRWIHDNVATQLVDVARRAPRPMASRDQPGVRPPGRGPPDRRPPATAHPVGAVEDTPPVDQQGPPETRLARVLFGPLPRLEGYDHDPQAQPFRFLFVPPQLRQVLPAGQSAEVSVEDHQEPVAPVVLEPMDGAHGVLQRKFDGRRSSVESKLHGSTRVDAFGR